MTDMREFFERQATWQSGRQRLSWPEKVRMAEAMCESLARFRNMRPTGPKTDRVERPKTPGG